MRRQFLTLCIALSMFGCASDSEEKELAAFAETFIAANQAASIEPMLALYALEGSTEMTVDLLRNALRFELGMPIKKIEFEPLSGAPEEAIHFTYKGATYGPTVEPLRRMHVMFATEDRFESRYTIGKNAKGEWRIVSSRPSE